MCGTVILQQLHISSSESFRHYSFIEGNSIEILTFDPHTYSLHISAILKLQPFQVFPYLIGDKGRSAMDMDNFLGGAGGGGAGQFPLEQWFYEMPVCTRWWTAATVATSLLVQCHIITPYQLFYSFRAVFVKNQVSKSFRSSFRFSLHYPHQSPTMRFV